MPEIATILTYARRQADELEKDMDWKRSEHGTAGGYWAASNPQLLPMIVGRAVSALEFFRQYAGPDSAWTSRAERFYESHGFNQSTESGARAIGNLLRAWADQVEAGIIEVAGARIWAEFGIASTDLMTQVRRLLEDRKVHPAAPIVLCGAALEMALRAVVDDRDVEIPERSTINILTGALRRAGLLTVQDVKDLEQCAGLRNAAAHGDFDELSRERAGLMEQQTNLLLHRLSDLQLARVADGESVAAVS